MKSIQSKTFLKAVRFTKELIRIKTLSED